MDPYRPAAAEAAEARTRGRRRTVDLREVLVSLKGLVFPILLVVAFPQIVLFLPNLLFS